LLSSEAIVSFRGHSAAAGLALLLWGATTCFALNPSLDVRQYAHNAWTTRDGFALGNIYAMAQTPDGYLWFGTEFGLFRFDGIRSVHWQPPAGEHLPDNNINSLLAGSDGTLWIGTFVGLASLRNGKLTLYPEFNRRFVESLFEDHEGTIWAGALFSPNSPNGLLCALRPGNVQCYGADGALGIAVPGIREDHAGNLWVLAQSGLWRWKPGPPQHYTTTPVEVTDLTTNAGGKPLLAIRGSGLMDLRGEKVEPYPIRGPNNSKELLADHDVDANKLLKDRDGGLWIGTVQHGLIHIHDGKTDVFTQTDGLSGDIVLSLLEDREGNIWVATTGGLDRFRALSVTTLSVKQGLSSDATQSVLAAKDGSIWIGTLEGLTKLNDRTTTVLRKDHGLPEDAVQSLYQDEQGRIWMATDYGFGYLQNGRFVSVDALHSEQKHLLHFITGDKAGNIWISEHQNLLHLLDGRLIEKIPWPKLGHPESAEVLLAGTEPGSVWVGFWSGGDVVYLENGQIRSSFTQANGLGKGHIADLQFGRDGALWASTQDGGLSRIKDGRVTTLSTRNGLPCDTIHWSIEDDDQSLWLYTACGLVRIMRREVDAWIADPNRKVANTVWDAADGVRLRSSAATSFGPRVSKSSDGKLWFLTGVGVQVVDPRHLATNELPPPVHIEQIIADHNTYWQNLKGETISQIHLPPLVHDLTIDFTAPSLVAPEKVHFKYMLTGQDVDWREVVDDRKVQYSNLAPGTYRFRVIASNNSGIWNEQGDTIELSVAPAYYQTNWFLAVCAAGVMLLLWGVYQLRVRQLRQELSIGLEAKIGERTRIARELHDTLLQSFHGLLFRFQAARNLLPGRPEEAIQSLDNAIARAEQALDEGRQSIQQLRSVPCSDKDLDETLVATGLELASSLAGGDPPQFEVIVEGERRALIPIRKEEVLRIAQESLQNAFRHAHAHRIEAEIRYGNDAFRLIVRDDGRGIDPQVLRDGRRPGHWGMPGMLERAREIGASLEFWSEAGAGTEVRLTLPAMIAYERVQDHGRLKLFHRKEEP